MEHAAGPDMAALTDASLVAWQLIGPDCEPQSGGKLDLPRTDPGPFDRLSPPEPIAVTDWPHVEVRLSGHEGKAVSSAHLPMSGPAPNAQAAVILRGAPLQFRIDMQTVGVPPKGTGMVLLALGGQSWTLSAGEYVQTVNVAFDGVPGARPNRWSGQLKLLSVALMVSRQ